MENFFHTLVDFRTKKFLYYNRSSSFFCENVWNNEIMRKICRRIMMSKKCEK